MNKYRLLLVIGVFMILSKNIFSQCGPLSTPTFTNNGQNGIMFDIVAINTVEVTQFSLDFDVNTYNIEIYYKPGTHVGFQTNAAAWTLLGSVNNFPITVTNVNTLIPITFSVSICPTDVAAFYVTSTNVTGYNYSNGTAVGAVAAADANMQILQGTGKAYPFGASFQPRVPNVTAHYNCPPPAGPPANAGPNQTICFTNSATMAASAGGSWSVVSGTGTFSNINDPNATVTGLTSGLNQFMWSTSCPTTTSTVDITYVPPISVNVPANNSYCSGSAVPASNFTSTPAGASYSWTNSDPSIGLAVSGNGNVPTFTATNTSASSVTSTITVTPTLNGCTGTPFTYDITVSPIPDAIATPMSQTICGGQSSNISLSSSVVGTTFSWTGTQIGAIGASGGSGTLISNVLITTGSAPGTVTYTITPSLGGCTGTPVNVTITVNPFNDATITPVGQLCANDSPITLIAANSGGVWSGTGVNSSTGEFNPSVAGSGVHTIAYITSGVCGDTAQINIIVNGPVASFSAAPSSGPIPLNVQFTDNSMGNGLSYSWSFGDGGTSNTQNPSNTYVLMGNYNAVLVVTDASGCTDTASIIISAIGEAFVQIPNIFSPNGDGVNDIFFVTTEFVTELKVSIFDRWGLELYSWTDVNGGWNGKSLNGKNLAEGTYFYVVTIKTALNETKEYTGHLTLVR
ncbi:MAG: gliding motility-associated C-terminal domain-containing protein [Flavobacteriales bacterium]